MQRFQFLLVNDEKHPELSSIKQQTSTSTCHTLQLLPASYQSRIRKPAENTNHRNHRGKNKYTSEMTHSNI